MTLKETVPEGVLKIILGVLKNIQGEPDPLESLDQHVSHLTEELGGCGLCLEIPMTPNCNNAGCQQVK